ncbi:MAG TPA: hypothetical protein VNF68_01135 [Candidatus Baltobacteraceae bacterium]|nr:hypothetical protein [Candidatus Baltobacteraceae bacterium]
MTLVRVCALLAGAFVLAGVAGNDKMAPLSQYLMRPQAEIALARSAAPAAISKHATIMVLTTHGYAVAQKGQNGFTCIVERGWMVPFGRTKFWSPKMLAPTCYNAAAARTVLLYTFKRTEMALAGASKLQIRERIVAAIDAKALPTPEPGAMAYMMSKSQYLNDAAKAWFPHVMIFTSMDDSANAGASWGADRRGSPVVFDAQDKMPEPWTCFFIPVSHWSDGSPAPLYSGT